MAIWNPWHGCHKTSEGCLHCYMFRRDESIGKVSTIVQKTADFGLALAKRRDGSYVLGPGERVYVCMTSDFFVEEADFWRPQIWDMIRARRDLAFTIITKRIARFRASLPEDWGEGWEHVTLCSTCENQKRADERLPILISLPLRHREMIAEPLLGPLEIREFLKTGKIEHVTCGGESGPDARECRYEWVLSLRDQCAGEGVPFHFKQTGANFVKDGRVYKIPRELQHEQARKANIDLL